ncbi:acetyl-CoA synthetase-like protein [Amniculicola lignicola CBS 123094]|uniref:Acetyl-CoA synthetase-like protein n=1 Tax=Amniculicola lignicola CBS 123094 TaxID=1392246 RepID=A0A6A5WB92_9PLEO|nr:acetyl-CoA synthetase-like protein [Amniculicola lignicola CBS 123094]
MMDSHLFNGLGNLKPEDQILVSRFGRGPSIPVPYPTIHQAFEAIVNSHPNVIAAKFCGKSITYAKLDAAANRLANHLIECGLRPRQRVCLVVQRSIEMLVGIFAVLKAGCQYAPIDGGVCSDQHLQYILTDTGAKFVLCLPRFEDRVKAFCGPEVSVKSLGREVEAFCPKSRPKLAVRSGDGAYAIYTSGSTGRPKGVDVSHGNVTNALLLEPGRLKITVGSHVGQVLNVAFDMGAWEILACLMNGGTLHIRGSNWEETLREIDTLIATPSILASHRRRSFPNIKTVVTGGEACPQSLADEWADDIFYYNICGPTEITILNSAHLHTPGKPLTIGRPLPNTNVYILDENDEPVPVGSKGVMWVGGAGVSKGYINLLELTVTRYTVDKFRKDGSMMFNTGDIVRWLDDGSLETFGRIDDQVKIKGFRVELDGVTAVIEKYPGITRAHTSVINGALYGFYTTQTLIDEEDLDNFVRQHLPYYSVPERWTYLPTVPLTPNGKVNRSQLSGMVMRRVSTISSSRRTSTFTTKDLYRPTTLSPVASVASRDPEKGQMDAEQITVSSNLSDFNASTTTVNGPLPPTLPEKNGFKGERWLRHRAFILYRRFFSVVVMANLAVAFFILYRRVKKERPMLADLATACAVNLTMAVLMRSEPVINLLFTIFCSVPTSFPLSIRRHCARIFHIGGIHSGCAIAAAMWFLFFACGASLDFAKPARFRCMSMETMAITYIVLLIFGAMIGMSHPTFRANHHDAWEMMHRFGGWTVLILLWCHAFLATRDLQFAPSIPMNAYKTSPPIWMLTVATMAIIFPWLHLRRVAVRSEPLSSHAIRLHFDYTTPVVGTSVRIAERPLIDWHGFATITNRPSDGPGFSLVVSNAGDFTKRTIDRAPTHVWVRGIPGCGVLRIATLFRRVVLVATGSGIGPCLAVILANRIPCRILWSTPNPQQTFGKEIVDSVLQTDPHAIIHNTRTMGKPDLKLMAWRLYKESGAEAVCIISNKRLTGGLLYALESRGVPAYGAIFDS